MNSKRTNLMSAAVAAWKVWNGWQRDPSSSDGLRALVPLQEPVEGQSASSAREVVEGGVSCAQRLGMSIGSAPM